MLIFCWKTNFTHKIEQLWLKFDMTLDYLFADFKRPIDVWLLFQNYIDTTLHSYVCSDSW